MNLSKKINAAELSPYRGPDPNGPQRRAADPERSVWVGASAGSGKTKVLTDRLLRLLLPGTAPHKILCLTFTRAAAREMALRLSKRLSEWAVMADDKLAQDLYGLLGREATDGESAAARRLFAAVTDAPGGINIMTIHSFCQSVLGRFPLEAGLPPHFAALDDAPAAQLLTRARNDVLAQARREPQSPLGQAAGALAAAQGEDGFDKLLLDVVRERTQMEKALTKHGGVEGVFHALCRALSIHPEDTEESLLEAACRDGAFDEAALRAACAALASGTPKTDQPKAVALQNWLDHAPEARAALYADYRRLFLTGECEPRKDQMTKKLAVAHPGADAALRREAERILALEDRRRAAECARLTRALLLTGEAVLDRYQALKEARAALDFDDLINRTRKLLQAENMAGWVMHKLDGGLDHILIDEAQDTNPEQWEIVQALCGDFFAGSGARGDTLRTLFCVGDEKQSIYSFQRAAPEKFRQMRAHFAGRVQAAKKAWRNEELNVSFRSTESVLKFVDEVFLEESVRRGLGLAKLKHESYRAGDAGLVEFWPLFRAPDRDDEDAWAPVAKPVDSRTGAARLAEHIGETVKDWLDTGEILESKGRPIRPGDIVILVRSRSRFTAQIIRALKTRGVPVGGLDRMVLKEQLAVQDLMAAAQVALLPEDDLSLACLLKSPLIGWDDRRLEDVAARRRGTLWEAVQAQDEAAAAYVRALTARAGSDHPYEFFSRLLHGPCPASSISGLYAMTARLGDDARDPLEELLNLALDHEDANLPALQDFLLSLEQGDSEVKRQQEEAGGRVRIMTVHGAKGLEAPIVILPDTVRSSRAPPGSANNRLVWPDKSGWAVPVWSPRSDFDCRAYGGLLARLQDLQDEEYRRLLYVALTRAGDRLYIGGHVGGKAPHEESWHRYMERAFARLPEAERLPMASRHFHHEGGEPPVMLRLSNPQTRPPQDKEKAAGEAGAADPAAFPWLFRAPEAEPDPPRPLSPSRPAGEEPAARSPLDGPEDLYRFRRGSVTHRLLQILPALPAERREAAARSFTGSHAADLPEDVRAGVVRETLAVMAHPDHAPLFGPGSLAEVPVTGMAGTRVVSGQIDRLLVTDTEIWIVDYKTNRPPPADEAAIPDLYRQQMKSYSDIVAQIYPGRAVRCFLLWTDGPRLMELK